MKSPSELYEMPQNAYGLKLDEKVELVIALSDMNNKSKDVGRLR